MFFWKILVILTNGQRLNFLTPIWSEFD